jgi:DnaJ-class molecular chaperone
MYDLSMPNDKPGECCKCRGTGTYKWGAVVNGKVSNSGTCWSCAGTGHQTKSDIKRDRAYNHFKIRRIFAAG